MLPKVGQRLAGKPPKSLRRGLPHTQISPFFKSFTSLNVHFRLTSFPFLGEELKLLEEA